jgi:hypothetical protein
LWKIYLILQITYGLDIYSIHRQWHVPWRSWPLQTVDLLWMIHLCQQLATLLQWGKVGMSGESECGLRIILSKGCNTESFLEFSIKSFQYNFVRVLYCIKVLLVVCECSVSFLLSSYCILENGEVHVC